MQFFLLGGVGAYQMLILERPRALRKYLHQVFMIESIFLSGFMLSYDQATALKVFMGARVVGLLWSAGVVGLLRFLGLAQLARCKSPSTEERERLNASADHRD